MGRGRRALLQAAFLFSTVPGGALTAQQGAQGTVLYLKGLHTGLCVQFLVAPNAVASYFGGGVLPAPVESLATAYPALARVASTEPTYRSWSPAEYCWYLYREAVVKGKGLQQDGGRQPIGVGSVAVAASGAPDSSDKVVVTYFTNSGRLAGALERDRVRVDQIDLTMGFIPEEEDDPARRRYTAKHGGTTVQWDGGPRAPVAAEPQQIRLRGVRSTGGPLSIRSSITPDSAWTASGSLMVSGNGELQRLMAASPIRLVTTFFRGGDSDWEFGR